MVNYSNVGWQDGTGPFTIPGLLQMEGGIRDGSPVDTIATLKSISVSSLTNNEIREVLGYYAIGDGGGGIFKFNSASSATANNGTIIAPNSGGGRWERVYDGVELWVKWFGARGDSTTDDSSAVQAAETARQQVKGVLCFSPGTYRITTQIDLGDRASWRGVRSERGAHAIGVDANYSAVRINWRPIDTTTYLFSEYRLGYIYNMIGPYTFEDITFDLAGANGIELGRSSADAGADTYVTSGVRFKGCAFEATDAADSTALGVLVRTGRRLLSLGWHFETVVEDCSFFGGDVQIYSSQGDMPFFNRIRHQRPGVPYEMNGVSGTVPGVIQEVQCEGWTVCAAILDTAPMRITDSRFENSYPFYANTGRITLPETFAVTAGSATITASASMATKLFPGTLLELSSGTNKDIVCVESVSGTTVVIDDDGFIFDWSAASATGVRILGHGPLKRGAFEMNIKGTSFGVAPDTPCATLVMGSGVASLSGCYSSIGISGDQRARVVGNHLNAQFFLDGAMYVDGCSSEIIPNPAHPFVRVSNFRDNNGGWDKDPNFRGPLGDLAEEAAIASRAWVFSPKSTSTSNNNWHLTPARLVAGDTNTSQQVPAWSIAAGGTYAMFDKTLPTAGNVKITLRARAQTTSGTIIVYAYRAADGASTTLFSPTVTTSWQTFTAYVPLSANVFLTSRTAASQVGFFIAATPAIYVAALEVEELVGPFAASGSGTPEAAVTAPIGSTYRRSDGGAGTSLYVKESGTGNTGWVGK